MNNDDQDDWYDSNLNEKEIERQIAQKDEQIMINKLENEGYREGLVRTTEEEEQNLINKGFNDGFIAAKHQFKVEQTIDLVLQNSKLFSQNIVFKCEQLKQLQNYDQVDLDQLLGN
ncbi:unnamed protein product [Paramecium pentaurelia]|uniref:Essential protein Yae1 N-terminal domain-containing protein n=1 Tax=Paramecium pentaurelia TaxID=43138 RepID=A0A8S1X486_9CILI|nr:unnamed protein product [Paramecium pentaurelia]